MRHFFNIAFSGLFVAVACADSPLANLSLVPIFDGKTLSGWHGRPHMSHEDYEKSDETKRAQWAEEVFQHWTVENGELVNDGYGPFLATNESYGDIELRLKYKTVAKADSGIYLRATPQVQIWDSTEESKFALGANLGSGALWNNSAGAAGKDPLTLADLPGLPLRSGHFGFAGHNDPVKIRNIQIRRLDSPN